jgi:hypothetical protein
MSKPCTKASNGKSNEKFRKKRYFFVAAATMCFGFLSSSLKVSAQEYNRVPASDNSQYSQCITYINGNYQGGSLMSTYKGQTKAPKNSINRADIIPCRRGRPPLVQMFHHAVY